MSDITTENSHLEPAGPLARRDRRAHLDRALSQQAEVWRDTLSSKLDQYRNRRGKERLSGEYTMSLDFERSTHRAVMSATARAFDPEPMAEAEPVIEVAHEDVPASMQEIDVPGPAAPLAATAEPEPEVMFESVTGSEHQDFPVQDSASVAPVEESPVLPVPKRKRPERKIIEFPRLLAFDPPAPSRDELAESILDRPRIMDVPEETEQIELPLGGISLDAAHEEMTAAQQEIDIPLQVAAVSQRMFAGITDNVLILIATAIFAGIVLNFANALPHTKLTLIVALVVPALFWTVYHYVFLVHAAVTPGMLIARIRLATFEGTRTNRNIRRARALAMLISCLSAGLGFLWAFVDEDTLCWHDKISRTYLANR